jgi:hypothetical protein
MTKKQIAMKAALVSTLILGAVGCQPHFHMFTAKDFVALEETYPYEFRAVTADGVVLAVREFENDKERADANFWVRAIENELRLDKGYALLKKSQIKTKSGLTGTQLRFGLDRDQEAHLYTVTVFVTERGTLMGKMSRVYVVESGGEEALVERHAAQLDWSLDEFIAR